jgi:hypothetical protein
MGSAFNTVVSLGIILVGTAVFLAVAVLLGSTLFDWLFGHSSEPDGSAKSEQRSEA